MFFLQTKSLCLIHGIKYIIISIVNIDENMEELYSLPTTPPRQCPGLG